jgi:hypothetical protein
VGGSFEVRPPDSLLKTHSLAMYEIFKSPARVLEDGFAARSHRNVLLHFNKVKNPFNNPEVFGVEVDYSRKNQ